MNHFSIPFETKPASVAACGVSIQQLLYDSCTVSRLICCWIYLILNRQCSTLWNEHLRSLSSLKLIKVLANTSGNISYFAFVDVAWILVRNDPTVSTFESLNRFGQGTRILNR